MKKSLFFRELNSNEKTYQLYDHPSPGSSLIDIFPTERDRCRKTWKYIMISSYPSFPNIGWTASKADFFFDKYFPSLYYLSE